MKPQRLSIGDPVRVIYPGHDWDNCVGAVVWHMRSWRFALIYVVHVPGMAIDIGFLRKNLRRVCQRQP